MAAARLPLPPDAQQIAENQRSARARRAYPSGVEVTSPPSMCCLLALRDAVRSQPKGRRDGQSIMLTCLKSAY